MEPDYTRILYAILIGVITSFFSIFTIIICIYYTVKVGWKTEGVLLITGSSISILCAIATQIGVLYSSTWSADGYLQFTYSIQGISFVGSLLFTIGFLQLILKIIRYTSQISKN